MYWRRWGYPPPLWRPTSPEEELEMLERYKRDLEREIEDLKKELKEVEARIEELRKAPPTTPLTPRMAPPPYAGPGGRGYGWGMGWWGAPQQMAALPPPQPGARRVVASVMEDAGVDSRISEVFGRAPYFAFIDIADGEVKSVRIVPNQMASLPQGVGFAAAQLIVSSGAESVIATYVGPNVSAALTQAGINIYTVEPGTPLLEALKRVGLVK